jgi:hypothetical protein
MTTTTSAPETTAALDGPPATAPTPRVTMVVGMHRSGTSFLTGSLQQAGLELGKHSQWNRYNVKGNRENIDFVTLHDDILAASGFAWNQPPEAEVPWSDEHVARAKGLVRGYAGCPHWGFKDPRATLLVAGWRRLVPSLEFVGIFRHPHAVRRSLEARAGLPVTNAYELWSRYNRALLELHAERPFPVLCFDEDESVLLEKLDELLLELGLRPATEDRFFSGELKHHGNVEEPLPADLERTYAQLRAIAR